MIFRRLVIAIFAIFGPPAALLAQDWPNRTIRIIVPFPAGGSADIQSRVIAEELARRIGQPVVIENKPGAGGNVAAAEAARAAPDGYTLFMATTGTHSANASLYDKLPFDPVKDFEPLTLVTVYPQLIVPGQRFPQTALPDLIAALKGAGDTVNYGSSGVGSPTHLGGELFRQETGTRMVHVPYRGQGPALNDLLGGRLDLAFPSVPDSFTFVQTGQLRAVAIMNETRSKALPDVPTTVELGYPKLLSSIWAGLYTRAGTPEAVLDRLNRELVAIVDSPAFRARFEALGFDVRPSTRAAFGAFAASETTRWREIIKANNIRVE